MTTPDGTPTLDNVAELAGVSTATVSRFINSPKVVAKATAARIEAAIERTGYIPNLVAGGLASNRSRLVAVLIPYLNNSIFNDVIEAMVEELTAAGMTVMLGITSADTRTEDMIKAAISRRADAIISTGAPDERVAAIIGRSKINFIQIWDLPDEPVGVAVGFSHRAAGRDIARFLRGRGYCRPHLITAAGQRAEMRREGFIAEWREQGGGDVSEDAVDIPSHFGHARRAFANMRRLEIMPDVMVCGSDYLAMGLIVEAQAGGLRVPEDIGVVGFGNSSIAGEMRPTITTVDIDGARIAREAMAVIRRNASGEPVEHRIDVGFRLIARESA